MHVQSVASSRNAEADAWEEDAARRGIRDDDQFDRSREGDLGHGGKAGIGGMGARPASEDM